MQLSVITNEQDVHAAQKQLQERIHAEGGPLRRYRIGNIRGQKELEVCYVERLDLWHAAERLDNRWSNGFGLGDPETVPILTVVTWINAAFDGSRRTGAGAFVRDADGHTWLAHSGRIGGGKKGIGRTAFLDGFSGSIQTVEGNDYIVIGRIAGPEFLDQLAAFVRAVQAFKIGVGGLGDQGEEDEDEAVAPSYWKVAPGEKARLWPQCRDGGYIAIGWDELGDLSGLDREGFDARVDDALIRYPHWKRRGVEQAWRFLNIPPGARIVANDGTRRVVGIGTVTGPYHYVDEGTGFAHRLPVRWDDVRERVVEQPGWLRTIIQLSPATFAAIMEAPSPGEALPEPPPPEAEPEEKLDFGGITDRLDDAGLRFPDEIVASYLLALQAKRFVILSGISGTGKTQLALAIAQAFQPRGAIVDASSGAPPDGHRIRVQPYMLKYHKLVIPAVLAESMKGEAATGTVTVRFGEGRSELLRWSGASTATQLLFKGEFREWFEQTLELGDELELRLEGDDLPILSITPASAASGVVASRAATYAVIAVRPDWTDNRGLLGYHNPITSSYQTTPFLRLLLAAADEEARATQERRPRLPFFVVLDEMNLARVEHYFSDFLSCLESGEPLHLHDDPLIAEGASETGEAVPRQLPIPRNLFFTGTVNVDETTYMFSPKVLDRAFVLEFNDVDLGSLGAGTGDDAGGEASVLQLRHFAGALDIRDKPSPADYVAFRELAGGALHRALVSLNDRLQVEHRHFGYRVANEIARFVGLAENQAGKDPLILWEAFDVAVVAKVLPKLHGTQQELEDVLARLLAFAVDVESPVDAHEQESRWTYSRGRLSSRGDGPPKAPKLPRAAAKLWRMLHRVRQQGYVSFIE